MRQKDIERRVLEREMSGKNTEKNKMMGGGDSSSQFPSDDRG